ncbi:MAG: hypothetical protein ACKV2O_06975 [Acidimicrobiales bacterium]
MPGERPYRKAGVRELFETLARLASGRPRPELVLGWVLAMLEAPTTHEPAALAMGDVLDSVEVAHAFRCEEVYVGWCCEVGVRRGQLAHRPPPRWPGADRAPLDAWSRSTLDPLARLALEADFDDARARLEG